MVLAYLLSLGMLFGSANYDEGCTQSPYSCGAPSCISESQKEETIQFCNSHGCGACALENLSDSCYKKNAHCQKQQNMCDWEQTPELTSCLKKADNIEATCMKTYGGKDCHKDKYGIYMNCMLSDAYNKCIEDGKNKLGK